MKSSLLRLVGKQTSSIKAVPPSVNYFLALLGMTGDCGSRRPCAGGCGQGGGGSSFSCSCSVSGQG